MTNITYRQHGNYLIPNLTLPAEEAREIGIFGRRRLMHLKQHRKVLYTELFATCTLNAHLADINEQAMDRLAVIVEQMKAAQGVTEALKVCDPMAWAGAMNNIKACAEEIVNQELVYA